MELEARNRINGDYNKFFYTTMCHVCKRFGNGVQLESCRDCKMISYCGQEHQKQHWKQHKPLCIAIRYVLRDYSMDYRGETMEEWANKKRTFAQLVSYKLGRHLNLYETEMFYLPRECLVCHEQNIKSLESCQKCAASFCKNHKDGIEHRDICAPLELRLCTDLFVMRMEIRPRAPLDVLFYLKHISCTSTLQNMKDFIKAGRNIHTDSEMSCNAQAASDSEHLTHPLTLLYAMRLLNGVPIGKDLVVHVIGARRGGSIFTCSGWEFLLRLLGTMVSSVVVIFTGPELKRKGIVFHTCGDCFLREKKCLMLEYHNVSYENYVDSSSFVKPDLVVGFNLCIHKHKLPKRSSKETWTPSIKLIAKQNCPFVLTSLTLRTFKKETDRINTILDKEVDCLYSGKNPFAGLKPHRTIGSTYMEYVCYQSQYVIIYRSLCS